MFAHVWNWFCQLSGQRQRDDGLPQPLSFHDITAWAALLGVSPGPHEIQMIMEIDAAFVSEAVRQRAKDRERAARKGRR